MYSHIHLQMMNLQGVSGFNDTKIIGAAYGAARHGQKYNNLSTCYGKDKRLVVQAFGEG